MVGLAGTVVGMGTNAPADVFNMGPGRRSLELVTVGAPGNAPDMDFGNGAGARGAVPYIYQIGKFDVTAAQYAEFLNAVAATDTWLLGRVWVARNGSPGSYTYIAALNQDFPVSSVAWGNAARFANWLTNGQPVGPEGSGSAVGLRVALVPEPASLVLLVACALGAVRRKR